MEGQRTNKKKGTAQISSHFLLSSAGIADQPQSQRRSAWWNVIFYYTGRCFRSAVRSPARDLFAVREVVGPDRK
ncbi:hypothetical protein CEXT_701141 [Caerostris extrusa]|uniref:Uncharacterized protein n=1 Tax=Caerostris extrusa TaxID=172846 RepID=A0AAV4NTE2_CAEEX|nr:hypothetical protein CEXT_701141 [Caerostris extrusa]